MNPLNDDELDVLLRQAKTQSPEPSPAFSDRVLRSYAEQGPAPAWGGIWLRPVRIPAAIGLLAAMLLIAAGAVVGRTLLAPTVNAQSRRGAAPPVVEERIVYRECASPAHNSEPSPGGMTFNELQPVREIRPRVVRSMRDDR